MCHSSIAKYRIESNERLEFLGDRVLGLVVADLLYKQFANEIEGDLGYRYTALVKREALASVAEHLDLAEYINVSEGALNSTSQSSH